MKHSTRTKALLPLVAALGLLACGKKEDASQTSSAGGPAPAGQPGDYGAGGQPAGTTTGTGGTEVEARVVSVDTSRPSITVTTLGGANGTAGAGERTVTVGSGAMAELASLKAGDQVTLTCDTTAAGSATTGGFGSGPGYGTGTGTGTAGDRDTGGTGSTTGTATAPGMGTGTTTGTGAAPGGGVTGGMGSGTSAGSLETCTTVRTIRRKIA